MNRLLLQFKKIVESGSINGASELLHVSQPTLTQNMKKLEEHHDVKLLYRTSKGIKTTAYGALLYDHVRSMEKTYQQALDKIETLKHNKSYAIQIGTGYAEWENCVKHILANFQKKHPEASIHVEFGNNLYLYDRALSGHLDLFFGQEIMGLDEKAGVEFIPLWDSIHSYFARKQHPLANKTVEYSQLGDFPWLLVIHHDPRYIGYIKDIDENPIEQERRRHDVARISTNSMAAGIELLKSQDLILPFPSGYATKLKADGIIELKVNQPAIIEHAGIYVVRDSIKDAIDEFVDHAKNMQHKFT
jgi:DNA-binding transcriptional LysR family regulator